MNADESAKPSTSVDRRSLNLSIFVPAVLLFTGQGFLLTTLPLHAKAFGVSYALISLAIAGASLGTLIADVPSGAWLSKFGLRRTMIIGAALIALGTVGLVLPIGIWGVIGMRLLAGIGTALWAVSRHAFIATKVPVSERGRALATFGGIFRIGLLIGPAAGGILASLTDLRLTFVASALMAVVGLGLALRYTPDGEMGPTKGSGRSRWKLVGGVLRANRADLSAAFIAQTFAQMIRAGRQFLVPIYGADVIGLNAAQLGIILSVAAVLDVAMFVPAGILMDRFGRKVAAVPSFAIMAVGVAMIPFAHSAVMLTVAAGVIGFGNGLGSGTMMTLGADLAPDGATGEFLGVWRLIGDAGAFLGPVAIGVIAAGAGLSGSSYILSAFGVIAALAMGLMVRETR